MPGFFVPPACSGVLARDMNPSYRREGREPFRPFDRDVVDRHRLEIGTQLDLEVDRFWERDDLRSS